jgi:hypothetical protein
VKCSALLQLEERATGLSVITNTLCVIDKKIFQFGGVNTTERRNIEDLY